MTRRHVPALLLSALLVTAGVTHLVAPRFYDGIVPHALPFPARWWTLGSGVIEIGCAVAVARPSTRPVAALATAILFIVVFPANIQMAIDWWDRSPSMRAVALGRLPLQIPLVIWALAVHRRARQEANPVPLR